MIMGRWRTGNGSLRKHISVITALNPKCQKRRSWWQFQSRKKKKKKHVPERSFWRGLPRHLRPWHISLESGVHSSPTEPAGCGGSQMKEDAAVARLCSQAGLSDNRWDVECLLALSTPGRSVSALCIVFDDGPQLERYWRRLMKHAGGWLQWGMIITSSLLRLPSSPPTPSLSCHSSLLSPLPFSTRGQVSLSSLLSRLPITHTVSARQLLPRKQSDSGC